MWESYAMQNLVSDTSKAVISVYSVFVIIYR